jgi:two-component system chemotaxis response regulator CheY
MARVLVCDDSSFMRDTISNILIEGGHEVVGMAADGNAAAAEFGKLRPDIVTMDIIMEPDGVGAIKKIMANDANAKIVIVSVLEGGQSGLIEGIKVGALGYIRKPVDKEHLLNEIDRVMAL